MIIASQVAIGKLDMLLPQLLALLFELKVVLFGVADCLTVDRQIIHLARRTVLRLVFPQQIVSDGRRVPLRGVPIRAVLVSLRLRRAAEEGPICQGLRMAVRGKDRPLLPASVGRIIADPRLRRHSSLEFKYLNII